MRNVMTWKREEVQNYSRKALIQVRGVNFVCYISCTCFRAVLDVLECVY